VQRLTEVLLIKEDVIDGEVLMSCVVVPGLVYEGYSGLTLHEAVDYFHEQMKCSINQTLRSNFKLCLNLLKNEISDAAVFDEYERYSVHFVCYVKED